VNIGVAMTVTLDVSRLPSEAYTETGSVRVNLAHLVPLMQRPLESMEQYTLVKPHSSFGCAFAKPGPAGEMQWNWDDPYDFTYFVAGWGPDRERYIANAVRKLRATLREDMDTLLMRISNPGAFQDPVDSVDEDGNFPWGDFPWGGATFVHVGDMVIPSAVSSLLEVEDDFVAKLLGGLVGATILKQAKPNEFGPKS